MGVIQSKMIQHNPFDKAPGAMCYEFVKILAENVVISKVDIASLIILL